MKNVKLFEEFVNEDNIHYYGVDRDTEMRAGGIGSSSNFMPWKNSKGLITKLKKFVRPSDIKSMSSSRVTISGGSKTYITFKSKDGFNMEEVIKLMSPGLERFCKVEGLHILFTNIEDDSFSLMIQTPYDEFTDNKGKMIDLSKVPSGFYIRR